MPVLITQKLCQFSKGLQDKQICAAHQMIDFWPMALSNRLRTDSFEWKLWMVLKINLTLFKPHRLCMLLQIKVSCINQLS